MFESIIRNEETFIPEENDIIKNLEIEQLKSKEKKT